MRLQADKLSAAHRLKAAVVGAYERDPSSVRLLAVLRLSRELAEEIDVLRRAIYDFDDRVEMCRKPGN